MANGKIVDRILRDADAPGLFEALTARLSPTDLQSLMLEVYRERCRRLGPAQLLRQYQENRFVQPARTSPQALLEVDRTAFKLLPPGFEVVQLSPVCPLGTCSVLAPVDQNKIVSTARNTEVCSDSTNVLALECARRRRPRGPATSSLPVPTKLCASQRLLRAQRYRSPRNLPHFQTLGLVTGGRDTGSFRFEMDSLREHADYFVRLIKQVANDASQALKIMVQLTAFNPQCYAPMADRVLGDFSSAHPDVTVEFDQERERAKGYYEDVAFRICAADAGGTQEFELADGGNTDWTQQLLNNRKERLFVSGMGTERLLLLLNPEAQ